MQSFVGHGDSINEIRTQPLKPSLIVSASKVSTTIFLLLFLKFLVCFVMLLFLFSFFCVMYVLTFLINQDESVRLWNVETGICILIFAGAGGHRNEVLSVVSAKHN